MITDQGVYLCKNGSFVYIQNLKENNDFISGIDISDQIIFLSHHRLNHVSIYKWGHGFSYEVLVRNKVMYHYSSKERQFKSCYSNLRHNLYSKNLGNIHAIIGGEYLYRVEIDLINLDQTKKTRLNYRAN